MSHNRWLLPLPLLATLAVAGWAVVDSRGAERSERLREGAHGRRMGDTLIQQGISLYQKGEYKSAVSAWERYLQMAPPNADTQCIREMIGEAKEAAARKAQKTSATACCPSIWIVV